MEVTVNGDRMELEDGATVIQVVQKLASDGRGVAVAVNGEVVSRGDWTTTRLGHDDKLEVLHAIGGGA
jgi:sulfur carrier protein